MRGGGKDPKIQGSAHHHSVMLMSTELPSKKSKKDLRCSRSRRNPSQKQGFNLKALYFFQVSNFETGRFQALGRACAAPQPHTHFYGIFSRWGGCTLRRREPTTAPHLPAHLSNDGCASRLHHGALVPRGARRARLQQAASSVRGDSHGER